MALTDLALAAFYLDPFSDKSKLSEEQIERVKRFLDNSYGRRIRLDASEILQQLDSFVNESETVRLIKSKIDEKQYLDFWNLISA